MYVTSKWPQNPQGNLEILFVNLITRGIGRKLLEIPLPSGCVATFVLVDYININKLQTHSLDNFLCDMTKWNMRF